MSNSKLTIENVRTGAQKTVSERTWQLMANASEQGDVRKGYRLLAPGAVTGKRSAPALAKTPSFIPPEVEEAAKKKALAEVQTEASMISGAKVAQAEAPAPEPTPVADEPAATAPAPEVSAPASELTAIEGITKKVAEVLAEAGIKTVAQLAKATAPTINAALDAANLGPKKAQVPSWKQKATTLNKA
jgi:predicted flap endonuclease-1-like 5' DNA nuclease